MTFQNIVDGTGKYRRAAGMYFKDLADHIICADGTKLSVQASSTHYCTPRVDIGPYTHVEVGYLDVNPPETWARYAEGDYPSPVYGYVPVELIREYIEAHGGEREALDATQS